MTDPVEADALATVSKLRGFWGIVDTTGWQLVCGALATIILLLLDIRRMSR